MAERATTITESARKIEREAVDNEKEREIAREERRTRVCETEAGVYICNESFIDVVAVAG